MARERRTYAKLHRMTVILTEQNIRLLERLAEYSGISLNETLRRILYDYERERLQRLARERDLERANR
jgi:predicted transcriptional regulator